MADEKNIKQPYLGFDKHTRQVTRQATRQVQHKQLVYQEVS